MNRRTAVKQLFILAGGLMIATSCTGGGEGATIELKHIKLTLSDEEFLGHLVEVLIPESDSPGAKELNLHLFVMKMLDDCHSPEEQEAFIQEMKLAKKENLKTDEERLSYLKGIEEYVLFKILKRRTIQGYLNSAYVMKNKLIYELVPGRYDGAVIVNA